jgi:hypothetical protein
MRRRYRSRPVINKANLDAAFKCLRGTGLLARQSFMCCSSCAGYQMALDAKKLDDAGKAPTGCVFYHKQDAENLREGQDFYLAFGQITHYGDEGKQTHYGDTAAVGKLVVDVLSRHGVKTEWDGNPNTRIKVKFDSLGEVPETVV